MTKYFTISGIAANNAANGHYFWSKGTKYFFSDCPSNWTVVEVPDEKCGYLFSGRVFIRQKNKHHRLYGQVRECLPDSTGCPTTIGANISNPIERLEKLTGREIKIRLKEGDI